MKRKMTEGKIFPNLLSFALPLVIGSLFQLTYNLFDYIVLGWFSSNPIESQAAIGIAGPIMNIFISLFSGLCVGAGIHSSELFGNKDIKNLKRQFSSFFIVFGLISLGITLLFLLFLDPILTISNVTDPFLKKEASSYLAIVALGFIFCFIYNVYASTLRSMGDSFASLLFLIISCVLNISLNVVFVVVFDLEVLGVALSTLISQVISAISIVVYGKLRYPQVLKFKLEDYCIDRKLLKTSASYAIASALQQIVLFVGKYLVSIQVNKYDAVVIDAFSAASKIDDFVFSPAQNFAHATAIFIAQNKGAKQYDRAKKGYAVGFRMNLVYGVIISLLIFVLKEDILNLFISNDSSIVASKKAVIDGGVTYLNIMCMLYMLPCITNSIQCYFRGIGKLNIVFYSTTVQIFFRVLFVYLLIYLSVECIPSTAYATGIGWGFMILFELPLLIYYYKNNKNLIVE